MGVIDLPIRIKACNRQKLLWDLHCKQICTDRKITSNKPCKGCRIFDELQLLGEVFNSTVRDRETSYNVESCDVCGKKLDINKNEDFFIEDENGSHVYCEKHWNDFIQ